MSRKKTFVSAVGAGAASRITTIVTRFFAVPLTVSLVSLEKYGLWLMILSFTSWLTFADLGIPAALQNRLIRTLHSGKPDEARALVSFSIRLLLAVAVLIAAAVGVMSLTVPWTRWFGIGEKARHELVLALALCLLAFAADLPSRVGGVICVAHGALSVPSSMQVLSQLVSFGFLCVVVFYKWSNLATLAGASLAGLVFGPFLLTLWALSRFGYPLRGQARLDLATRKALFGKGFFFLLASVGGLLILQSDAVLIGAVLGPRVVPLFVIPGALWLNFLLCQNMFLQPLWPVLSRSHSAGDRRDFVSLIRRALMGSLLGGFGFSLGLLILGDWFVRRWSKGIASLPPVMATGFAAYVCCAAVDNLLATVLDSAGWIEWRFRYCLGFGIAKVAVGYLTLRHFGIEYLPWAYALTMAATSIPFALLGVWRCVHEIAPDGATTPELLLKEPSEMAE